MLSSAFHKPANGKHTMNPQNTKSQNTKSRSDGDSLRSTALARLSLITRCVCYTLAACLAFYIKTLPAAPSYLPTSLHGIIRDDGMIGDMAQALGIFLDRQTQRLTNLRTFEPKNDMASYKPSTRIVTTDVPDPDNFLMVLRVLKDHPDEKIDIVLSPRPVDFAALQYGKYFGELAKKLHGVKELLSPFNESNDQTFMHKLDDAEKMWFYFDDGFEHKDIKSDTKKYMEISYLRMITYLDAHNVDRDQYSFYWDTRLTSSKSIQPGLHHAAHKPDFTFDFDHTHKDLYAYLVEEVVSERRVDPRYSEMRSKGLRERTKAYCDHYISTTKKALNISHHHRPRDLSLLIDKHRSARTSPEILVGGPFTEAVELVNALPVRRVVAMGGCIDGSLNIFPNQFNFMIDMDSARKILNMAQSGDLDLTLLPTECVKSSLYSLTPEEFHEYIGQHSAPTAALYDQWQNGKRDPYNLFDMIAVMAAEKPELFDQKRVRLVDDGKVLHFEPLEDGAQGPAIKMFWNERQQDGRDEKTNKPKYLYNKDEKMTQMRDVFLQELQRTFA